MCMEITETISLLYQFFNFWTIENYDKGNHSFAHDQDILDALKESPIVNIVDFRILIKQCMPFFEVK